MSVWLIAALAIAAAPKPTTKPSAPQKPVVAVVELKGLIANDADRVALDDELRAMLPDFDLDVQKKTKTQQAQKDLNNLGLCADAGSVECLVQVGALSKARIVLAGVVAPVEGGGAELALEGVDVNAMKERGRVKVVVPLADVDARKVALESALVAILRPEQWQGTLRVSVAQRGASIYVDGAPRGFAPLAEPLDVTPGSHAVFVSLEGFAAFKEGVVVDYHKETGVDVSLSPGVTEPPPKLASASIDKKPIVDATPPAPAARKTPLRVVMYDVDAVGVDKRVARVIGELLVAEIRKREKVSVLDESELRALVGNGTSTAVDARHCSANECFAEVAEALGADVVMVSQLTNVGGEVLFGLRRVDPKKQEVAVSFLERVPAGDTNALLPLVGKSIAVTFADVPLRAGQQAGVDERAPRILNPPPLPPLLAGSLYAGSAATGIASIALFATSAISAITYNSARASAIATSASGPQNHDENGTLAPAASTATTTATLGIVAIGATAVLGAAGLVAGQFTDWDGYAARESTK